jgi:hypothetical protein
MKKKLIRNQLFLFCLIFVQSRTCFHSTQEVCLPLLHLSAGVVAATARRSTRIPCRSMNTFTSKGKLKKKNNVKYKTNLIKLHITNPCVTLNDVKTNSCHENTFDANINRFPESHSCFQSGNQIRKSLNFKILTYSHDIFTIYFKKFTFK